MLSQTQGSHRAVRRGGFGGRGVGGGQAKASPRVPEQRYEDRRGLAVRPGIPYAPASPAPPASAASAAPPASPASAHAPTAPVAPVGLSAYVPPAYAPAPPRGRHGRHGKPQPGRQGPPPPPQAFPQAGAPLTAGAAAPAPPPPASPPRHARNPYDTYRPSYEQPGRARHAAPPAPQTTPPAPQTPPQTAPRPSERARRPPPAPEPVRIEPARTEGVRTEGVRTEGGRAAARRAARARKAAQRPEALRRLVPQALVVAFLAGGTSAFVAHDKEVEFSVDGTPRTLHTFADDVGELLAEEGVKLGEHDAVGPSPSQPVQDGDEIGFTHGRPLDLTLDGKRRTVWTTELTVRDALRSMGVRTRGASLSLAPSADIPRSGLKVEVRTERSVTFTADGGERTVRTNAGTVLEALAEAGIELHGLDATSAPMDSFPRDGQTIAVMRITGKEKVKEERIGFKTVRREDPLLPQGTEVVAQAGSKGLRRVTYRLRTVDGVREKPRRIAVEVLRRPRKQIIHVGTMPLPRSVPGADHLNWAALARCESGGRPAAVDASGSHGGLYQFDAPTWHAMGGSGRPQHASAQEQTYRAKKLYVSEGASPWPYCARKLAQ